MRPDPDKDKSFDTLKGLLVKPEQTRIQTIEKRLDDPVVRAKEISQSLPHAISLSVIQSDMISRVIEPVIDRSLKTSVRNNPKAIADAIFPALGPGIRKAIASTILGMIQSLNTVLNHSISIQGLKWRFQAFKTQKTFAEVVLLNTLVYQVEQIFLIHSRSGLVLEHVVSKYAIIQDPDLVSAMLTAIQDFVQDSFASENQDDLDTLRIGTDRSIWIEKGEHALIAAVIRGTPPVELRQTYQELIEDIHIKSASALENFDGDPLPFTMFKEQLKGGLQFKAKTDQSKTSPWLWIILTVIISLGVYWAINTYQNHTSWNRYLSELKTQKGLIITHVEKTGTGYTISGLKDPMTPDPQSFPKPEQQKGTPIIWNLQPYYSLDPQYILERARTILQPPEGITLSLSEHTITVSGQASNAWLSSFRSKATAIPGITGFKEDGIENTDRINLIQRIEKLSQLRIYFQNNSDRFIPNQEKTLEELARTIQEIETIQSQLNNYFQITILGHTDSSGGEKLNLTLSRNRAEKTLRQLIILGINPSILKVSGIGPDSPLIKEEQTTDKQYNRAVSFKIFYIDSNRG